MKIGYACIPLTIPFRTNRRLVLKDFTYEKASEIIESNLSDLYKILEYNKKRGINLFRISSDIIPLGSHEINDLPWKSIFKSELASIGNYIKENSLRVSMHPGQYTIINSPSDDIVNKSIRDFEYHTDFLDSLGVDYTHKLILHIGGVYGDKPLAKKRFIENFKRLSSAAQKRMIIENDEKNYSLEDVLEISEKINIPVVYDNLHNTCYGSNSLSVKEIYKLVHKTWKKEDGNMKVHYSQQAENKKIGSHSTTINIEDFLEYFKEAKDFDPDIMLEVKDKDISSIKVINSLNSLKGINTKSTITEEWAKYKYVVMAYNYEAYKTCRKIIKDDGDILSLYKYIDETLKNPLDEGNYINTLQHIWGYFKDISKTQEKNHFTKMISEKKFSNAKDYLFKLTNKYDVEYLKKGYFFHEIP
ncbi:UV DNA damage repair endonuclease UvsE [Clostridium intestinale]|uniref:UV damage endonuclease n=1 Tax=Clostridium intestinale URNW TaxID=1294142 RepID=U2PTE1_9CLOT|nr:UV DNA damage repair endonuclease UvsE [Clostridium intestinale]ERK29720.1 UV damage endonuclease [Clostridium intestinale URNW]